MRTPTCGILRNSAQREKDNACNIERPQQQPLLQDLGHRDCMQKLQNISMSGAAQHQKAPQVDQPAAAQVL